MSKQHYRTYIYIIAILSALPFFPPVLYAQIDFSMPSEKTDGSITINPRDPQPGQRVTAEFTSFSFDRFRAYYTWIINGKQVKTGTGANTVEFEMGSLGTITNIQVTIKSLEGNTTQVQHTLAAHDIDMAWSAETYTPPGYRGKALPTVGSLLNISAIPHVFIENSRANPATLYYQWSVNDKPQKSGSGIDKQTLSVSLASVYSNSLRVALTVSNPTGTISYQKHIEIPMHKSRIQFYELDPLRGPMYQNAFQNAANISSGTETVFLAEPYYYSLFSLARTIPVWSINSNVIDPGNKPFQLAYRSQQGQQTTQSVSLKIQTPQSPLETTQQSFHVYVK